MEMQKLIELIEQWAINRGLDKNGTVEGQLIKTAEEVAELIIGISKGNLKLIKDSVGDVFVTLVIGSLLQGSKNDFIATFDDFYFIDCVESAYKEIADRKGVVKNGTFIKESDLI